MKFRPFRLAVLSVGAAVLCAAALVGGATATPSAQAAASSCAKFRVSGKVANPLTLRVDALRSYPRHEVDVSFQAGPTVEHHHYVGALLTDVLATAQPQFDPAVKNDALRFWVKAIGSDRYAAIVAWGEIDPNFGNKEVLLAYKEDANSLCAAGPRLVVPGDIRGGRYVTNVVEVKVGRAGTTD